MCLRVKLMSSESLHKRGAWLCFMGKVKWMPILQLLNRQRPKGVSLTRAVFMAKKLDAPSHLSSVSL